MFSNDQIEYLRNYFQVISESGTKLPNIKDTANGYSYYLQTIVYNSENEKLVTYIKYTVIKGEWHIEQIDEDNFVRNINIKDKSKV